MNIIRAALRLAAKVTGFRQRAREFYYAVMLAEHRCPRCNQPLAMVRESWCGCRACGLAFDPTVAFQRCPSCGGAPRGGFDLRRYQTHIVAHLQEIPVGLDEIPPLIEDRRLDRIWRFIAVVFLAHAGTLDVWQEGMIIKVIKHETHAVGQGVPGETEEPDRGARLVGRAAA